MHPQRATWHHQSARLADCKGHAYASKSALRLRVTFDAHLVVQCSLHYLIHTTYRKWLQVTTCTLGRLSNLHPESAVQHALVTACEMVPLVAAAAVIGGASVRAVMMHPCSYWRLYRALVLLVQLSVRHYKSQQMFQVTCGQLRIAALPMTAVLTPTRQCRETKAVPGCTGVGDMTSHLTCLHVLPED